ncbi:MAG: hypothetical protein ACREIR_21505, partial [Geminicoccaceae bacterium]
LVTPRARFTFAAGELTLDAVADGVEVKDALDCLPWTPKRSPALAVLAPIEPALAKTAGALLDAWGHHAP